MLYCKGLQMKSLQSSQNQLVSNLYVLDRQWYIIQYNQSSMENNKSSDQIKKFTRRSMSPIQFMSTTEFKSKQKIGANINFCFMPSSKIEELKLKKKGYSQIRKNINQGEEKIEQNQAKQHQQLSSFEFSNSKFPNFDDRQRKDISCDTEADPNFQEVSFTINNSEPSRQYADRKLIEKIAELQAINQQKTVIIGRQNQQLLIVQKSLIESLKRQQQQRQEIRKLHLLLLVQQRRNQEILGEKKKMIAQQRRKERVNDQRRNRTLKENRSYNDNVGGSKNELFYLSPDKFDP